MATAARSSLKIGLIPADGIGREVIPVSTFTIQTEVVRLMKCLLVLDPGRKGSNHRIRIGYSQARVRQPAGGVRAFPEDWHCAP